MMMHDKKKMLAMIIKGADKPHEMAPKHLEMGAEQDHSVGINSAAEELLNAIDKKDVASIVSSLRSFMELCEYEEPKAEEEGEQEAEMESEQK